MAHIYKRREFIKTVSGLGMISLLPACSYSTKVPHTQISIPKRLIPGTNESLPLIGFGSTAAVRLILEEGPALLTQLIETMIKYGASVIDTAPREEEVDRAFGQVLMDPKWQNKLFVTSKIGMNRFRETRNVDKQGGIDQIRQTRRLFNRHPADLIQVESMTDLDIHWPTLREWKDNGDARYIGITSSATSDHARMEAFMKSDRPDFIQVNYSLLEFEAEQRVLPLARDLGIAVLINSPFNGGEYFRYVRAHELPVWAKEMGCETWAQFNLKYILADLAVNCVLTETTKPANLEDNMRAALGNLPDAGTHRKMRTHFASLLPT